MMGVLAVWLQISGGRRVDECVVIVWDVSIGEDVGTERLVRLERHSVFATK